MELWLFSDSELIRTLYLYLNAVYGAFLFFPTNRLDSKTRLVVVILDEWSACVI